MFAVTGASGALGSHVLDFLGQRIAAKNIVALARDPAKLADRAAQGVVVRAFDYNRSETLELALAGVKRLLLISSSEIGQREAQHKAVIQAAQKAGIGFIAYTSILHAETSPLDLATEHRATEQALKASGVPYALLRNGWYNENYTADLASVVEHGVLIGSSGDGRVAAAARRDYAEAAAIILTAEQPETRIYELAGDTGFTQAELAAMIARITAHRVIYENMPEELYRQTLIRFGLPASFAHILADSSAKAEHAALFDESGTLGQLIGRPTTPIETTLREALGHK